MSNTETKETAAQVTNFIRNIIEDDLARNANQPRYWCGHPAPYSEQIQGVADPARIRTRFPPEPNGYLHIGHAKSICLNFGLARDYGGYCHMRFDDTNPVKEDQEYVDSIMESVRWLGFDWKHGDETNLYFASNYFQWMYDCAEHLVKTGFAYVDEQSADEMHANRGTLKEPGKNSPYRDRTVEENLRIFREMRDGKHAEGNPEDAQNGYHRADNAVHSKAAEAAPHNPPQDVGDNRNNNAVGHLRNKQDQALIGMEPGEFTVLRRKDGDQTQNAQIREDSHRLVLFRIALCRQGCALHRSRTSGRAALRAESNPVFQLCAAFSAKCHCFFLLKF